MVVRWLAGVLGACKAPVRLGDMSKKTQRHGKGGSVGQHFRATPDLRSFDVPPAGVVTVKHPDGIIEVQPAQPTVKSRSKRRRTL